ncbi:D-alanyl-D-alanine carboxypeptidase family protein [Candidatus Saccharibacteria bacterium]|nr:D-alanyl-D-alanine carboxypeptidase family protein [Candidatus Saccharibacteria bacterium]
MKKNTQKRAAYCVLGIVACAMVMVFVAAIEGSAYAYGESPPPYSAETFDEDIAGFLNPELDYLIIVNEDYPYDFDGYQAQILKESLIEAPDVYGEATKIERATYIAFTKLQAALAEQNVIIGLYSAYRTWEDQQWVCDHYGNINSVMPPGYSEHHTGLVINFLVWHQFPGEAKPIWGTISAERRDSVPEFQVIYDTLADYGFIERYPANKEYCTGVPCKPYEIRFVGDSDTAHMIMDNDYTLEEYLGYNEYLVPEENYESDEYCYPEEYYYTE